MNTTSSDGELTARVAARAPGLSPRERAVAQYLLERPQEFTGASAAQIAEATGTSDATVVRTARSLGYTGLRDLKRAALASLTPPRDPVVRLTRRLDRLQGGLGAVLDQVLADTTEMVGHLPATLDTTAWERAVDLVAAGDRVWAYGIGPAALAAEFLVVELTRFGHRATAVRDTGFSLADPLMGLGPGDVVVIFAPLRLFHEIDVVLERASTVGAPTILISEAVGDEQADVADVVLSMPQTADSATSEHFAGMLIARALGLELAARDRVGSVEAWELLLRLRTSLAGPEAARTPATGRSGE